MPPPYDTVISIGGQSLVDGIWRLLGPALAGLSNPLPISLPGFTNSALRIKRITPVFPGTATMTPELKLKLAIELNAEALLKVKVSAGDFTVQLGQQNLNVTNLKGKIGLNQVKALKSISLSGSLPTGNLTLTGDGDLELPLPISTAPDNFTNGSLTGTLSLPNNLTLPGIPLPAVVPIAVNFTPSGPIEVDASLQLLVNGSRVGVTSTMFPATFFGLVIEVADIRIGNIAFDSALDDNLTVKLNEAVTQIVKQLNITIGQDPPLTIAKVNDLLAPVPALIRSALDNSLTALLGGTGRLVYPPAGTGASCDVRALPTTCDTRLSVGPAGSYALQLGFGGRPTSSDIPSFPAFAPTGLADTTIVVGNRFLLGLLCCLIERLPGFTFPVPVSIVPAGVTVPTALDVNGVLHTMCGNFNGATINIGPISLNGGLSVCIDGTTGSAKRISLVGRFAQRVPFPTLTLADIDVSFTLPITFDLDDAASLANVRAVGSPSISVFISPKAGLVALIVTGGILLVGPAVATVALLLLYATCETVKSLLASAVNTVLGAASLVRSPVAIPPGVFEAFGKLVPVSIVVDDLTADSVLQTPTSPWALLPCNAVPTTVGFGDLDTGRDPDISAWHPDTGRLPEV